MQCPFCQEEVGTEDDLQLHCLVCSSAYAGIFIVDVQSCRKLFSLCVKTSLFELRKHDEKCSPLGRKRFKTNAFWIPICLWLTEPGRTTTAPAVDSVVVRFRWVKSRPCFEREVHLISSLVSTERNTTSVSQIFLQEARDFQLHRLNRGVLLQYFVNLEDIRKLNWRNWLCFRLFTFDNALWSSRAAFVRARLLIERLLKVLWL